MTITNRIFGYLFFEKTRQHKKDECEIMYLYVSKTERGKEIGKSLIKYAERNIKKSGARKVILTPTTIDLIGYYTKLGYSREEDRIDTKNNLHIIMSKSL